MDYISIVSQLGHCSDTLLRDTPLPHLTDCYGFDYILWKFILKISA